MSWSDENDGQKRAVLTRDVSWLPGLPPGPYYPGMEDDRTAMRRTVEVGVPYRPGAEVDEP